MIKIIKSGKRIYKTECKCGCVFSFEKEDIQTTRWGSATGALIKENVVYCPECREPNIIVNIEDLKGEEKNE